MMHRPDVKIANSSNLVDPPLVSVVTATYNRSNVLNLCMQTVLWQTHANWEQWVVGDACTDDTEDVVASFNDPRIHFHNLPENAGEQSIPNNYGLAKARGKYVAMLNHDDLWFPDHLEKAVEVLERTGADLAYAIDDFVEIDGTPNLFGIFMNRRYEPGQFIAASSWIFKRELVDEIGFWNHFRAIYNIPSRDWITRVWQAGKKMEVVPNLGVIAIPSNVWQGSYSNRLHNEHDAIFQRMQEPNFREGRITEALFNMPKQSHLAALPFTYLLRAIMRKIGRWFVLKFNRLPVIFYGINRMKHKGHEIDEYRQIRGLKNLHKEAR